MVALEVTGEILLSHCGRRILTFGSILFHPRLIYNFEFKEQSYRILNGVLYACNNLPNIIEGKITYSAFKKKILGIRKPSRNESSGSIPKHANIRGKEYYE